MSTNYNKEYEEWKLNVPNGSLNEYYSWLRNKGNLKNENSKPVVEATKEFIYINQSKKEKNDYLHLIIGIVACTIGLIGFFTPWLTIPFPLFKISISGYEINQLSNYIDNHYVAQSNSGNITNVTYIKYIFSLPIAIVLVLIAYVAKSNLLTTLFTILYMICFAIFFCYFINNLNNLFTLLNYGFYLTALSVVISTINLFNLK